MTELSIAPDHFWTQFKADVAGTLSDEQKTEINRVLGMPADLAGKGPGDLRLSFGWGFLRLMWGLEKRNPERVKSDEKNHPVMTRRNVPALLSLLAGYAALWYILLSVSFLVVVYYLI